MSFRNKKKPDYYALSTKKKFISEFVWLVCAVTEEF